MKAWHVISPLLPSSVIVHAATAGKAKHAVVIESGRKVPFQTIEARRAPEHDMENEEFPSTGERPVEIKTYTAEWDDGAVCKTCEEPIMKGEICTVARFESGRTEHRHVRHQYEDDPEF